MSSSYQKGQYPGIYFRQHDRRRHRPNPGTNYTIPDRYYIIKLQLDGRRKTEGLGWASEGWTEEQANSLRIMFRRNAKMGEGPTSLEELKNERKKKKELEEDEPTMSDLWDVYHQALKTKKKQKAETTLKEENRKWDKVIEPVLGEMKVKEVKPFHLNSLLEKEAMRAPVNANRLHSLLKIMFKPALARGWIEAHPLQYIDKPGGIEPPRKRVLSDDELNRIWPFFCSPSGNFGDILKLILLSCQRPGEIMSMQWEDINLKDMVWTIRDTKTGNDHICPVSPQMELVLSRRRSGECYTRRVSWKNDSQYVFPTRHNGSDGHTRSIRRAWLKIHKESGIDGWTAHDLRRTGRTLMSRLSIKHHVRERVLNHSQGGVVGVYDLHDYLDEKREALKLLGEEVERIVLTLSAPDGQPA